MTRRITLTFELVFENDVPERCTSPEHVAQVAQRFFEGQAVQAARMRESSQSFESAGGTRVSQRYLLKDEVL